METLTELQAIEKAKSKIADLPPIFTFTFFNKEDLNDFVFGFLYDEQLQYFEPIGFLNNKGITEYILIHEIY